MHGEIDVQQVMREAAYRQELIADWQDRMRRDLERQEERDILARWWRADETARQTIVQTHKAVFDRITANRHRVDRLRRQERAAADRWMRSQGYLVRMGPSLPRYIRPSWSGVLASLRTDDDQPQRPKPRSRRP